MSLAAPEVLVAAVQAANDAADYVLLERRANELLERSELVRDRASMALAYRYIGNARVGARDADGAERAYRTAMAVHEDLGDAVGVAVSMLALGNLELELRMNLTEARRFIEEALPTIRAFGSAAHLAIALGNLGEIVRLEGDYDLSMLYAGEALDIFEDIGDRTRAGAELLDIAHCRVLKRDYHSAKAVLEVAYAAIAGEMNPARVATYFDIWFMFAVQLGAFEDAALLLGFLEEYRDRTRVPRLLNLMPWFSRAIEAMCAGTGEVRMMELRVRGAEFSLEAARELTAKVASQS